VAWLVVCVVVVVAGSCAYAAPVTSASERAVVAMGLNSFIGVSSLRSYQAHILSMATGIVEITENNAAVPQ